MAGLDWLGLMRVGLQGLGLRPSEFWALTPAELNLMLGRRGAAQTMDRAGLDALLAAYPDRREGQDND
ncbi:phage tail assembly chaperone [Shimia sp. CNT1-13L.2]|uniref:rcc01693 family protein n=1 Tax=Shimia sp. CNT1-13L.2 TaxID=2959663 RepID=UPI0020CC89A1|nr:rcc01693 family protein [Shimia sp. CNT1-13L.2]MCP9483175.1 phage tail assembly chaperone [Shimia sp. CNT1-13L.2]